MKSFYRIAALTIAALGLALVRVEADQNITNNGVVWTYTYEGNFLPSNTLSNPGWTEIFGGAGTSESVAGGILTVSTSTADPDLGYRLGGGTGLQWDPTALGSTVEVRLKTDSQIAGKSGAGGIEIRTGSRYWGVNFGTNQITEVFAGGSTVSMDTSAGFHDYRFTIDGTGGPLTLYVDGGGSPVASWVGIANAGNLLDFGDTMTAAGGQIQWDYLRWTNVGAIAPVPEPSVVWLAAIGVMTMTILRARRACRS